MAKRITYIPNRVIDADGISDGASIYVYQAGTTTPVAIYSDSALTTPLANPIVVALGAPVPPFFHNSASIRLRVVNDAGTVISDDDPYDGQVSESEFNARVQAASLLASDFGYVGPDGDSAPAINAALAAAAGRFVQLPAGVVRIDQRINLETSGNRVGARLVGQGEWATFVECNYDDDTENGALRIFGSLTPYQFQYGTVLRDFTIRPAAGREVAYGIDLTGQFRFLIERVRATGFRSSNGGFGAGLVMFNRPSFANPDAYAAVSGEVRQSWLIGNHTGAALWTGQGAAGVQFINSSIQGNDFDGLVCPSVGGVKCISSALAYNGALVTDFTAATTSGSNVIVVAGTMPANMAPGREVRGPGIPAGAVVESVAGANVTLCEKGEHNQSVPVAVNASATSAAASLRLLGGYGVSQDGPYQGEANNILLEDCEMDGNTSGAAYFYACGSIRGAGNRVITRVLNGEERSLDHFVFDPSRPNRHGALQETFHRVDVVLTEQNEAAVAGRVRLYNGGASGTNLINQNHTMQPLAASTTFTASTTNGSADITVTSAGIAGFVAGQLVSGAGIPAGASIISVAGSVLTLSANATAIATGVTMTLTVPVTKATGAFIDQRWKNSITEYGVPQTVLHREFYMRASPTQGFTTTQTSLKANAASTGWLTPNLNTTGQFTPGFNGTLRIKAFAVVSSALAGDVYRVRAMKNGVLQFDWQSTCPANASRFPIDYDMEFATAEADVWTVEVFANDTRSLFGAWQLVAQAVG